MSHKIALSLLPLLTIGCAGGGSEFADVLPDDRLLLELPANNVSSKGMTEGEWSEFYLVTSQVTDDVNGLIGGILHLVDNITDRRPSWANDARTHAIWGPYSTALDPVDVTLHVEYAPLDDTYTWYFNMIPKGEDGGEEVTVVAGEVDAGATRMASSGRFTADFTTMQQLDPTTRLEGLFYSDYEISPTGVIAEASVEGFGWQKTHDAFYTYSQEFGGEGEMDLAWEQDADNDGIDDTFALRSRWFNDGDGRGDALVTSSRHETTVVATECWNTSFNLVYGYNEITGEEVGSDSDCAYSDASYVE